MIIIKKNRKLRMIVCITMIIFLFFSNIAPAAAMALEMNNSQAVWQQVLAADLTEYQGERFPLDLNEPVNSPEPVEEQAQTQTESPADMWLDTSYETDRFIVVYKETITEEAAEAAEVVLEGSDIVESVDRLETSRRHNNGNRGGNVRGQLGNNGRNQARRNAPAAVLSTESAITVEELEQALDSAVLQQIEYIQPDYEMTFYALDGDKQLNNATLSTQNSTLGSAAPNGIVVALLDTGVDTNHPDLSGKLMEGYDFVNDVANVNSTEWYYDQGHGTSLAGAITNGGATVLPLKVFEGGKAYTSDILAAIAYAEENGAVIANVSFGSRFYNPALEEAIAGSDMLFVCASGNILLNIDKYPVYPASFDLPNVLSVAAVDNGDKLARFSNYGVSSVDIAARGVDISVPFLDNATIETSGTSVSAALVSAAASQTLAAHNDLDAAGLKQRLIDSADAVTGLIDKVSGGKRLNVPYAVSAQTNPNTAIIDVPDPDPIPDVMLDDAIEEEYEEFGADGLITYRTPMPTARYGLGVVVVGKKIYAIGGKFNDTYYDKVEIYDTETDTWTTGANMPSRTSYFSCLAVGTDIYCFGGWNVSCLNNVQVYNTVNNTWSVKKEMPLSLEGNAAVEYEGSIYITGGRNGSTLYSTVYQYNIAENTWAQRGNLINTRVYHNAFMYDGKMYIGGGVNSLSGDGSHIAVEEVYDLSSGVSIVNGSSRVYGISAAVIIEDSRLIVIGGSRYLNRDPRNFMSTITHYSMQSTDTGAYLRRNVMSAARDSLGVAMVDGVVYMIGGKNDKYAFDTVEVLESGYTGLKSMPENLKDFAAVELAGNIYVAGGNKVSDGTVFREMYAYNIINKTWQQKAALPGKTSTLLSSVYGKLYLFDYNNSNAMRVFEYDPQANIWTDIAPAPKMFHTVQALNGKIYAISSANTVVDVFNPLTKTWSQAAARPNTASINDTAVLDGKLYMNDTNGNMHCYDPASNSWSSKNTGHNALFIAPVYQDIYLLYPMSVSAEARTIYRYSPNQGMVSYYDNFLHEYNYFYQTCTVNNKVYIFAGQNSAAGAEAIVEYMPSVSPWLKKQAPQINGDYLYRGYMAYAAIKDKVYLAGGYDKDEVPFNELYEYDVQTDSWSQKASMDTARYRAAGVAVDNKFYAIGGTLKDFSTDTNKVEEYDPSTNEWKTKKELPYKAHSIAAAACDGKIYTFGGRSETTGVYNYVYEYDPVNDEWTPKKAMPVAAGAAGAAELNGKIYVAGGWNASVEPLNTLQVYDPQTDTWSTKTAMPSKTCYCSVVADDAIYVIGGSNSWISVNTVYQYNPNTDKWYHWPGLDDVVTAAAAVAINNSIYVVNGISDGAALSNIYYAATSSSSISSYAELTHLGSDIINPSGNLSRNYSDLNFDAPGFTVNVSRTYNSIDTRDSVIGKGWTFGFFSKLEAVGNDTVIRMPDGSALTFNVENNGTYIAKDSHAKLVKSGTEHTLTTQDHYQYQYNTNGYLYRMTDPNGNQINLTVNDSGQVTQVTDAAGRKLDIAYASNRVSTITESTTGLMVRYIYDGSGRLGQVTVPDGGNTYYTYQSDGLLYQVQDHNKAVLEQFEYETPPGSEQKRIKTAKLSTGNTETYIYNVMEGTVTTTTDGDRTIITHFDKALYPIQVIDAEGGQRRFEYNLDGGINRYGEIKSTTDRNGNTTHYEYDERGNVTKIVYPDRSSKLFTYDAHDNLISEIDELGHKTFYTYDSNHNLLKRIKPLDGTTAYSETANQSLYAIESKTYYTVAEANTMCGRDIGGLLKTARDAVGNTITYTYDTHGNLAGSTDSLGRKTTYNFNIIGWLKQQTSPMGYTTQFYYDKCGRLVKKTQHGGESERYVYDRLGNLTQSIEPNQYADITDSTTYTADNIVNAAGELANTVGYLYTYTPAGLVATSKDPRNTTTSYTYDTFGNKTREARALYNTRVYTYLYDKLNRPTNKSYLESGTSVSLEDYSYPLQTNGTVKQITKVYFSATDYADTIHTYDFANRLIKTENPDGGVMTNAYLPNGLTESTTDAMGNTTYFEYNPLNQMVKRWTPHDGSLYSLTTWQYDGAGRVTLESNYANALSKGASPSGQAGNKSYTYNIDSTVKDITENGAGKTSYLYNNGGQISQEIKLQDTTRSQRTDYTYNHLGKIVTSTVYAENKDIYGRSDDSTLFGITTGYTYDANGNLATVTYANNETVKYEYDTLNRQTVERRNVPNENNAITTVTRTTAYDSMGNLMSRTDEKGNITLYSYSQRGFLVTEIDATNAHTWREYDLQGRLVKEYSPRALLEDEPGHIVAPPLNINDWNYAITLTNKNYTAYVYDKMSRLLTKTEYYRPTYSSPVRALVAETNTYDKNGNLLTNKDALNNITTYTYSKAGLVTNVRNQYNQDTKFTYDGLGRLTQQTDARGAATQYSYDLFGNVLQQSVGGVTVMTASYDLLGNPLTKTDANGNTTSSTYTLFGQTRSVTNAVGYHVRQWYDVMGNNTRSLDSLGKEILNSYDGWGRLLSVTQRSSDGSNALSRSTRYDVLGNPIYVTDERGNTTQYTYDKVSRVIAVKNALDQTSTVSYDANGNKVAETNWLGNTTIYRYDILDRLIAIIDPTGTQIETLTYTDTHRQATSTDALGHTTVFTYDNLGRQIAITDVEGYVSRQGYDAVGNIASKTDANNKTTTFTYDNLNRLTTVTGADNSVTSYTYDAAGNVLTQNDGRGYTTHYEYNELNQPILRADPGGISGAGGTVYDESRIERLTYYPNGQLQSRRDKNGITTSYTYDMHGRKISENVNGAITSYSYDDAGNLLTVTDSSGAITRTYDALNRAVSKTVPQFGTTTFCYDITSGLAAGQIGESTTIDGRTITRVFDKAGRLTQVREGSATTSYEYYGNGSLKTQSLPNGVTANYTYFANNRLHTLQNKRGSIILEAYQYAYDGVGNITAKQDVKGTTRYTYTSVNQLAVVEEPSGKRTAYVYDAAGNRRTESVTENGQSVTTTYTVNEQNRLLSTEQITNAQAILEQYFYDDAGNMLGRKPEVQSNINSPTNLGVSLLGEMEETDLTPALYSYNDKNQMVAAYTGNATITNTFNAEGFRFSKTADDVTTYYCYEYDRIIKEQDTEGNVAYHVYGINLISRELDGDKVYYIYNGHGDVTGLLSSNGTVIASYYYDAFGVIVEQSGNFGNPYRYAGYMYDEESSLYNLNARFYDAKLARFMQEDTFRGNNADPLSLNLYTYCKNNPLIYFDPTGHDPLAILAGIAAANAAAAGIAAANAAVAAVKPPTLPARPLTSTSSSNPVVAMVNAGAGGSSSSGNSGSTVTPKVEALVTAGALAGVSGSSGNNLQVGASIGALVGVSGSSGNKNITTDVKKDTSAIAERSLINLINPCDPLNIIKAFSKAKSLSEAKSLSQGAEYLWSPMDGSNLAPDEFESPGKEFKEYCKKSNYSYQMISFVGNYQFEAKCFADAGLAIAGTIVTRQPFSLIAYFLDVIISEINGQNGLKYELEHRWSPQNSVDTRGMSQFVEKIWSMGSLDVNNSYSLGPLDKIKNCSIGGAIVSAIPSDSIIETLIPAEEFYKGYVISAQQNLGDGVVNNVMITGRFNGQYYGTNIDELLDNKLYNEGRLRVLNTVHIPDSFYDSGYRVVSYNEWVMYGK